MLVLNCYGKIDRICISRKLGMYISNLPNSDDNNWKDALKDQLKLTNDADSIYQNYLKMSYPSGIVNLYHKVFPSKEVPVEFTDLHYEELAEMMTCISLDYEYADMPLGGWDKNCFDGRLCEDDCTEKIIGFMNFLVHLDTTQKDDDFPAPVPQWVYSSNHDEFDHYRLFWGGEGIEQYQKAMIEWGNLFDTFLVNRERYLQFDYLINSIYKDSDYNEYHLIKDFSLCQLFLEKECEGELDTKLPIFLPENMSGAEKMECAKLLRQLRNKIAHGDFLAFEDKIEEYAKKFLDGKFAFDYFEYSRKNWVIIHVCCLLDDVLRRIMHMMFYNSKKLDSIKNS